MFTLQSQHHVVGRSISCGEDKGGLHRSSRKVYSLQYRPRRGSSVCHRSNMSSLQVNSAAEWSASAHRPDHDRLSEKEHINFIEPDINPVDYAIWGAHQQRVYHRRQLKTV